MPPLQDAADQSGLHLIECMFKFRLIVSNSVYQIPSILKESVSRARKYRIRGYKSFHASATKLLTYDFSESATFLGMFGAIVGRLWR